MDNNNRSIQFDASTLPATVNVPGFNQAYQDYLSANLPENPSNGTATLGTIISGIGILIIVVGALILLFGPEYVTYNRYRGPTFFQFLQLYPGPITTGGFLVAALGQALANSGQKSSAQLLTEQGFLLTNYPLEPQNISPFMKDDEFFLFNYDGGDQFTVELGKDESAPITPPLQSSEQQTKIAG